MRPQETVGAHVVASVLRARPDERAADLLARLASEKPAIPDLVLATDAHGRFIGAAPLGRVLALDERDTLEKVLDRGFPHVHPNTDQPTPKKRRITVEDDDAV